MGNAVKATDVGTARTLTLGQLRAMKGKSRYAVIVYPIFEDGTVGPRSYVTDDGTIRKESDGVEFPKYPSKLLFDGAVWELET